MSAKFLEVALEEDGSGAGGYAKEMSKEWFDAANEMLLKEMADTNVVIFGGFAVVGLIAIEFVLYEGLLWLHFLGLI